MELQHIVVATDLSEASKRATQHAARLARFSGGRVTLLFVDEVGQHGFRSTAEMNHYLAQAWEARSSLLKEARQLTRDFEVSAVTKQVSGDPVEQILSFVRRAEADLLILAKRGLRSIKRLIMGGTIKRVVRRTQVPTLVLPLEAGAEELPAAPVHYNRLVCATDFSANSRRGLLATLDLGALVRAHVEQIHVLRLPVTLPLPGEAPIMVPRASQAQIRRILMHNLSASVGEEVAKRCTPSVVPGNNIARSINEAVASSGADMICIPTRGKSGAAAALFGSTAESVIKLASVPVLILPAHYLSAHYGTRTSPAASAVPAERAPRQTRSPAAVSARSSAEAPGARRRQLVHWRSEDGIERIADERRRELRLPVDFLANLYIAGEPQLCHVTNMSRHGALLDRLGGPRAKETRVELELQLPGQVDTTYLSGQVTHRTKSSVGIRLAEHRDRYQQRYVRYIDRSLASLPMT